MARSKRTVKTITSIADLRPDPHNANKGTIRGRAMLASGLEGYGAGRSVLVDIDGVAIAGSKTLEAAAEKGFPIRVVRTDGTELVVVRRADLRMATDAEAKELGIADSRVAQIDLDWDTDALKAMNDEGVNLSGLWFDFELEKIIGNDAPPDQTGEWQGLPEFTQDDVQKYKTLTVHFDTEVDFLKFVEVTGLPLTDKTRFTWYPFRPRVDRNRNREVDE